MKKAPKPRPPYGKRLSLTGKRDLNRRAFRIVQRVIAMGTTLRAAADAAGWSWNTGYKISTGKTVTEEALADFESALDLPAWTEPPPPKQRRFLKRQLIPHIQQAA